MMENISHSLMSFIWNAASLILLLSIVVTIHEGGHFWVARKLGVKVLKFSIGFGIVWNGFKIRGVLENALGVGGSVMSGFSGGAEDPKKRR